MSLAVFDPRAPRAFSPRAWLSAAAARTARRYALEIALFSGLSVMLAGTYLLFALADEPERPAATPAPVAATWVDVNRPLPMFSFAAPEFARAPLAYRMRRHTAGGGREDALTLGAFADNAAWLRIVVHQVGGEGAPRQTLFVETARRAAEAGVALDSLSASSELATRFGPVEWAEAKLAVPGQAGARQGCSVFRFAANPPAVAFFGLACAPAGAVFSRRQMSCLVGGLDLAAASEDADLQKFFARSELARDEACTNSRARAAAAAAAAKQPPVAAKPKLRASIER